MTSGAIRLAAVLVAALGLAACGSTGEPASPAAASAPATTPAADPEARLAAATREIAAGNYRFGFQSGNVTGTGYAHRPSGSVRLDVDAKDGKDTYTMRLFVVGPDSFAKVELNGKAVGSGGKWFALDKGKAAKTEAFAFLAAPDVGGATDLLATARSVTARPTGELAGTVDITKVDAMAAIDEEVKDGLGAWGGAVPFTATLDDQGRITKLVLDLSTFSTVDVKAIEVTYSDYGAVTPDPKPTDTVNAPADFYDDL